MSTAFADSELGDSFESQLTLGTGSLLSIFFGLVLVCGIFFGLGFSLGRRNWAQMTAQKPPAAAAPRSTPISAPPKPASPDLAVTSPPLTAQLQEAPLPSPTPLQAMPTPVRQSSTPATAATKPAVPKQLDPISTAIATPPALRPYIPKPSAIHAVVVQPQTGIPYGHGVSMPPAYQNQTAANQWKWTPPFDVHPRGWHAKPSLANTAHFGVAHPAQALATSYIAGTVQDQLDAPSTRMAAVVQIAALSRADDAQVLAEALRKGGFIASIQSGNEDALYHVQVGPVARRVALMTQQRLLAKGYNAVVK